MLIVIPAMVTVRPELTWKMRNGEAARFRWTERASAPGPLIVRFFVILSSPLVRMIAENAGRLKLMVPPAGTSANAWRSEPAPASLTLVTVTPGVGVPLGVGVGVVAGVDVAVAVAVGVDVAVGVEVAVGLGDEVAVAVGVGDEVAVAVGVGVEVGVGAAVGVGVAADVTSSAPMSGSETLRVSLSKSIVTLPRGVPTSSAGFGVPGAVRLRWRSPLFASAKKELIV